MAKVEALLKLDYSIAVLDNTKDWLCVRYPEKIFIPQTEHVHHMTNTLTPNQTAIETLTETTAATTLTGNGIKPAEDANNIHAKIENGGNVQQFVTFADQVDSSQEQAPVKSQAYKNLQQVQQQQPHHIIYEAPFDINQVQELIQTNARFARCRTRFVVPVILFRGKYICRSSTVSLITEQYSRKVLNACKNFPHIPFFPNAKSADNTNGNSNGTTNGKSSAENGAKQNDPNAPATEHVRDTELDDPLVEKRFGRMPVESPPSTFGNEDILQSDIQLLRMFNVNTIVDFMVEKQKKKFLVPVTSSEKADELQRYRDFTILNIPYPGCEFFKDFRDNNYVSQNLYYNWNQSFIDAPIRIPPGGPATDLDINWSDYEKWDLMTMTQNYLKAILKYVQDDNAGILVHCISGWDRTPLFISLLRLSLWADGLIHQSLGPLEISYFTLAYDWYLFGHQLPDRLCVGEDILIFCFHFLKYVCSDEFRVNIGAPQRRRTKTSSSSSSSVVVIRPDSEDEQRDEFLLDMDSNGSSNCDKTFGESFYVYPTSATAATTQQPTQSQSPSPSPAQTATANSFAGVITQANAAGTSNNVSNTSSAPQTGRSPNPKRTRTSPIAVPGPSPTTASRQRLDSSSLSSWMIVSGAGSIDSMKNVVAMSERLEANTKDGDGFPLSNMTFGSTNSNGSMGDGMCGPNDCLRPPITQRRQRLEDVRNIVIPAYARMVGLRFNQGSSSIIKSITEQLW